MRKHVAPADPAATIPDPSRGRPLPPEGLPVTWGPYWAGLAARGDITVENLPDVDAAEADAVTTELVAEPAPATLTPSEDAAPPTA